MFSQFPALDFPVLALSAYHGSLGVDSGLAQNVYQLDTSKMKEFKGEDGELLKKMMMPGEKLDLPDGAGSITFDGVEEWASFQVSQQPGNGWALGGSVAAIAGLMRLAVHPAPPGVGAGGPGRRRRHGRGDGGPGPQRVREAPRGTGRPVGRSGHHGARRPRRRGGPGHAGETGRAGRARHDRRHDRCHERGRGKPVHPAEAPAEGAEK